MALWWALRSGTLLTVSTQQTVAFGVRQVEWGRRNEAPVTIVITKEMNETTNLTDNCFQLCGCPRGSLFPLLCSRAWLLRESTCSGGEDGLQKPVLKVDEEAHIYTCENKEAWTMSLFSGGAQLELGLVRKYFWGSNFLFCIPEKNNKEFLFTGPHLRSLSGWKWATEAATRWNRQQFVSFITAQHLELKPQL